MSRDVVYGHPVNTLPASLSGDATGDKQFGGETMGGCVFRNTMRPVMGAELNDMGGLT